MAKRGFLSVLAVPAAASALFGGIPAVVATTAHAVHASVSGDPAFGPLTSKLAATLAQGVDDPVIVILKSQASQASAGSVPAGAASAAAAAIQAPLLSELQAVGATAIKRFTLVNSVAATVSPLEARRLAADPAVAQVIPDAPFTVPGPAPAAPAATGGAAGPAGSASPRLNDIPRACAAKGKSQLAPEGLALTSTVSGNATAPTARSLGFTGAGVKVAYIADGLDPDNVNLKRPDGTSVFTDYKDFTGNGPNAPTTGGEAFLDANTIAGQGVHVYNVNGFSAQSYAGTTCDVRIEGVAPGASLVGLDVFSGDQDDTLETTTSMLAQAINYAVENDKVNVINESFGGNTLPDTTQDVVKLFDDAAVKAGVVVSVSSGDAGTANTIGSPATDPNVISVGATTQFQALAQANIGGTRYFATRGWLSDNISSFSSSGYDEAGGTVDMVAPGDLSWASCDANAARYSQCVNDPGNASDIEEAGGTSESAPFVSGAAALVIQAFSETHGGMTPTPAQVKQILLSTATDLGTPAQEQGAGLLNSYKAVQLAESYGIAKRTGATLLTSPGQLTEAALGGTRKTWQVTVTNEGTSAQTVTLSGRALNPASTSTASGSVTLSDATSNQYTADSGSAVNYETFKFSVPAGQARLDVSIAYAASPSTVVLPPALVLFDPDGRVAADSEPQGVGNYGNVDVRAPAAGVWTAVVSGYPARAGGYNGKVVWHEATQNYSSFGSVSPASLSLAPGQAKSFVLSVTVPADPGDLAGSVVLRSSAGGVTSIPVVVRSLVDVAAGGRFTGDLTGGNGRGPVGTGDYYQFTVPPGTKAVRAELQLDNNPGLGNLVGAYLVGPDGNVEGYGQNTDLSSAQLGITDPTLTATALSPVTGTWTLIVAFAEPVAGTEVSDPYTGYVNFTAAATMVPARPLPANNMALNYGTPVKIPVKITNTSNAPQDYYLDPRLDTTEIMKLAPLTDGATGPFANGSATTALPIKQSATTSLYFVPSLTSSLTLKQASRVAATSDLSTSIGGDPDVGIAGLTESSLCGESVSESYTPSGGTVTSGLWEPAPTECGPYGAKGADEGAATDTLTATTAQFDNTVSAATGDFEQLATSATAGNTSIGKAVELQAGQSATVDVTFVPTGPFGHVDSGTLYLDSLQSGVLPYGQVSGDEVAAVPYSYTVDLHD
jgi:Subtilase family